MSVDLRPFVVSAATLACVLALACGPKHKPETQPRPGDVLVVLVRDPDGGTGRALVSNQSGSVELAAERAATQVSVGKSPGPISTLSEAEVKRMFGGAMSALPAEPRRFTLNFRFESEELTGGARAVVPEVLKTVQEYTVPEVIVVGHTDRTGAAQANLQLGLKRARMVRNLLVSAGLDASTIVVRSHGEGDPLIRTPDGTREPRNRRVEISVR